MTQHNRRLANHGPSSKSKAPTRPPPSPNLNIRVGDLVYLRADRSKLHSRPRYLVCAVEGEWCNIRKFVRSQLRSTSYRVRQSDCLRVPSEVSESCSQLRGTSQSDEDDVGDLASLAATKKPRPLPDMPGSPKMTDDHAPPMDYPSVSAEGPVPEPPEPAPRPPEPPDIPHELSTPQDELTPPSPETHNDLIMPSPDRRYPQRNRHIPHYLTDFVLE